MSRNAIAPPQPPPVHGHELLQKQLRILTYDNEWLLLQNQQLQEAHDRTLQSRVHLSQELHEYRKEVNALIAQMQEHIRLLSAQLEDSEITADNHADQGHVKRFRNAQTFVP